MTPLRIRRAHTAALIALAAAATAVPWAGPERQPVAVAAPLPASRTFEPVADAYVRESTPNRAYGAARLLRVDGAPRIRSFLRFNVRGLDGQAVIGARLRLWQTDETPQGGRVFGVRSNAWTESVTWRTQPAARDRLIGSFGAVDAGAWHTVSLPGAIRGEGRVSFTLRSAHVDGSYWSSRESERPPQLILDLAPRIAAAGDIACDPQDDDFNEGAGTGDRCRQRATSNLLLGGDYAAVLALGDTQYEDGRPGEYRNSYDPSWGRALGVTHPAVGNHEYNLSGATGYFSYFGARAGELGEGWYSFDIGSWHIVALNSNCSIVGCEPGSLQEAWLRTDLASSNATCTLAFMHHAMFSSGLHGRDQAVEPLFDALYDAGVDVLLSGHDHGYERFAPQTPAGTVDADDGIRQFVVGTGGKSLRPFSTVVANSQERHRRTFGVLRLVLKPASYRWSFVPIAGGSYSDSGSTACE